MSSAFYEKGVLKMRRLMIGGLKMRKVVLKCGLVGFMAFVLVSLLMLGAPALSPAQTKAPAPAGQIVWKMDSMWPPNDPETLPLVQAANEILEYSEGRLKIEIYPSFSLRLNPRTGCSNMRDGLTEIANLWVQLVEGEEPSLSVTEATGIWDSKEQVGKAIDALIPFKKKVYREVWKSHYLTTKFMAVQTSGQYSNTRELRTLEDFKGFKIRVPSARQQEIFKMIGAAPVVMPLGDVYLSLKTGVIDGVSSSAKQVIFSKWYEVIKNGVEDIVCEGGAQDIVVSRKAWDALPDDLKEIVTTVFESVHQRTRAMAVNPGLSNLWKKQCEAKGVKFFQLSAQDLAKIKEVCWKIQDDFIKNAPPRTKEAWNIIKPILGK